jgi:hypothetical protein
MDKRVRIPGRGPRGILTAISKARDPLDSPPGLCTTRASGLAVFLELDQRGRLRSIEFGRPDDGADQADEVTVDGVDVFGDAADEVMHRLGARTSLREEDGGRTAVLDAYTVALWRPTLPEGSDDEEGRRFEAALVGVDGYFDADAASSG